MNPRWKRQRLKRALDVIAASLGLIGLLPLMITIAFAIRLESPGPVLYLQERLGLRRRPFRIIKFRTMRVDAERDTGPVWSTCRDPRVTAVGRVLRAAHLDELPQVWNVLRGEMSFVGPRPERAHFVRQFERLIPGYADRFTVLPGIAGLSQLRSGYDTSLRTVRRKTRYDRLYVRRAGTALDAALLVATFVYVAVPGGRRHAHGAGPASVSLPPSFPDIHRWRLVPIVAKLLLASPRSEGLGGATQRPGPPMWKSSQLNG